MTKSARKRTNYKNIYYNEGTKKYDVKYNYKEYDPISQKNKYKSQWVYNCISIAEAKEALAKLQIGITKTEDKDITLASAFELWKTKALTQQFSEMTIQSTEQNMKVIYKYLPANTKLKDITEHVYYKIFAELRQKYSEETVHTLNSTFRKLIKLSYKRGLIADNFLLKADNIKTEQKKNYYLLGHKDFQKIDNYLGNKQSNHNGYNAYPRLQFFYNVLYYTGMRLSECLALTWNDFETFHYHKDAHDPRGNFHAPDSTASDSGYLSGMRISVTKSTGREKDESGKAIVKGPKNKKNRTIPIPPHLEAMYHREHSKHIAGGGENSDRIFNYVHSYCLTRIKDTCKILGIEPCNCHAFRHTYISNLIKRNVPITVIEKVSGDTQETIFKRYSHMFEQDEIMVIRALENLQ